MWEQKKLPKFNLCSMPPRDYSDTLLGEDPRKVELLRITSFANALGAPVPVEGLLREMPLRDDPQDVIGSLIGEYLTLREGMLGPVHWVRSDHLARILHEGGVPSITSTALSAASLVPITFLAGFIAKAFHWTGVDREALMQGLLERFRSASTRTILAIVAGLFEAGEQAFFEAHRSEFDKAYQSAGPGMLFLVGTDVSPLLPVHTLRRLREIFGGRADHLEPLAQIVRQMPSGPRGLDLAGRFLKEIGAQQDRRELLVASVADVGDLLDWCAVTGARFQAWEQVREQLIGEVDLTAQTVEDLSTFAQGLFRYDRPAFDKWFRENEGDLLARLQLATRALSLRLTTPSTVLSEEIAADEGSADLHHVDDLMTDRVEAAAHAREDSSRFGAPVADVEIVFAVDQETSPSANDQAVERLQLLRKALPFVGRYRSRGDYFLPAGLEPPIDEATKAMPRWNLPLPSDVAKNVVWQGVFTKPYLPDTIYRVQEAWYQVRSLALKVARGHVTVLRSVFRGQPPRLDRVYGHDLDLVHELSAAAKFVPELSTRAIERLDPALATKLRPIFRNPAPAAWINSVENFNRQFFEFLLKREEQTGRLMLYNCREAASTLAEMHGFFRAIFQETPDYFASAALEQAESATADDLILLAEGLIDPSGWSAPDPIRELRRRAESRATERLRRIQIIIEDAAAALPLSIVAPIGVAREAGLISAPIGLEITDLAAPQQELLTASVALAPLAELIDRLWIVPLKNGARIGDSAYGIGTGILKEDGPGWLDEKIALWQFLFPVPVPSAVLSCLPHLEKSPPVQPTFEQRLLGLWSVAEPYTRRRMAIEAIIEQGDHPCLKELADLERARLADIEIEFLAFLNGLAEDLDELAVASPRSGERALAETREVLDALQALFTSTELRNSPPLPPLDVFERLATELKPT